MKRKSEIVLYHNASGEVSLNVDFDQNTVWATQPQIAELFGVNRTTVLRHIKNILKDGEIDDKSNVQKMHIPNSDKPVMYYSLDIILAVGYRTNSAQAIQFRRWATTVLRQHLLQGYTINPKRLEQLHQVLNILSRSATPEISGISEVLGFFSDGLELLDDYDHQTLKKPNWNASRSDWQLTYEEAHNLIDSMKFGKESDLFGREKDHLFRSALGAIYQTFNGHEVYATPQEKAANLLYMVVKNHAFLDGNKRIAAALFVFFLEKNGILFDRNHQLIIENNTLAAITLMIALSKPEEKDVMCLLVMNMLNASH